VYSAPIDVRLYSEAFLNGWQGTGLGASPSTVEFTAQRTMDFEKWFDDTPFSPGGADAEVVSEIGIYSPWLRVKAEVSGLDPGICCWLVGEFVRREGPVAGEAA
jgi:hypothetical protein